MKAAAIAMAMTHADTMAAIFLVFELWPWYPDFVLLGGKMGTIFAGVLVSGKIDCETEKFDRS